MVIKIFSYICNVIKNKQVMKKVYFNVILRFNNKKLEATIIVRFALWDSLSSLQFITAIGTKLKEEYNIDDWEFNDTIDKKECKKMIIDYSRKNEVFHI